MRIAVRSVVAICGALLGLAAFAQPVLRPLPPLLRTISDELGVLSAGEARRLANAAADLSTQSGVGVVMLILETTAPEDVDDYTQRLAQRWKRERQLDLERSIFVVVAIRERELRVMPGSELAWLDRELGRPGAFADLSPLFREKRFFEALMSLTNRLSDRIREHERASSR